MTAQIIALPTRPEADLRSLVTDVAHARGYALGSADILDAVAIATDIMRGRDPEDLDDPAVAEQAVEEAVAAWAAGVVA